MVGVCVWYCYVVLVLLVFGVGVFVVLCVVLFGVVVGVCGDGVGCDYCYFDLCIV